MAEQKFGIKSRSNGLPESVGKAEYPLHKQIAENKTIVKKYGDNGMKK